MSEDADAYDDAGLPVNPLLADETWVKQGRPTAATGQLERSWLASLLLRRGGSLSSRFVLFYQQIRALPRWARRRLIKKSAVALTGVALLLALSRTPARAANIDVVDGAVAIADNDICSLIEAIQNANDTTDGNVHDDCTAGDPLGADTISLPAGGTFTLTQSFGIYYGSNTGLPLITSEITIEGNGATIERDTADTDKFRLLAVSSTGDLTLNNVTLSGGYAYYKYTDTYGTYYEGSGGAVESHGALRITNSTISGNTAADDGGGIEVAEGVFYLTDSTVSENKAPYDNNDSDGGGMRLDGSSATITGSTINDNKAESDGGGIDHDDGTLRVTNTTIRDNTTYSSDGGAIDGGDGPMYIENSTLTGNHTYDEGGAIWINNYALITGTTISGNTSDGDGGGITVSDYDAEVIISYSLLSGNKTGDDGGGVANNEGKLTIIHSTLYDNEAEDDGGAIYSYDTLSVINSTLSNNTAGYGGGIVTAGSAEITNSTITGNTADVHGGGIDNFGSTVTFNRSLVSGNDSPLGREAYAHGGSTTNTDNYNLFGYNGDSGLENISAGASDIVPGSGVLVSDILDTTLADNGGPQSGATGQEEAMLTHALVSGSLAIDGAPSADCTGDPVNGIDQRGEPRNVNGKGTSSANECDIGAFEVQPSGSTTIYMTAAGPGTTSDGVSFGKEDILQWDGDSWSKFFDGTNAGLTTNHDIDAIHVNAADDLYLTFFQNKIMTADVGNVFGHDILHFDGDEFSFYFDGSDVGLSTTSEKVDALHILDGSESPIGSGCDAYLLISTLGTGKVPAFGGGVLNFQGEDILGFCATNTGNATAGFWHLVVDGSAEGMPKNSTDSISASDDGSVIHLTTKAAFDVDDAFGGHSMVYKFESGSFSGPFFSAPDNGLDEKVDGLHVEGDLP